MNSRPHETYWEFWVVNKLTDVPAAIWSIAAHARRSCETFNDLEVVHNREPVYEVRPYSFMKL